MAIEGLTTGRVVHYHAAPFDNEIARVGGDDCLAATVAHVWSKDSGTVNLMVLDANGAPHSRTSVPFVESAPKSGSNWHWPERA